MSEMKVFGMKVFVSDKQPQDRISIIGIDKGQPGGDWTAEVEMEKLANGLWRVTRYTASPALPSPHTEKEG